MAVIFKNTILKNTRIRKPGITDIDSINFALMLGLRKLNEQFTSAPLRVVRHSDSKEEDFGFNVNVQEVFLNGMIKQEDLILSTDNLTT